MIGASLTGRIEYAVVKLLGDGTDGLANIVLQGWQQPCDLGRMNTATEILQTGTGRHIGGIVDAEADDDGMGGFRGGW